MTKGELHSNSVRTENVYQALSTLTNVPNNSSNYSC